MSVTTSKLTKTTKKASVKAKQQFIRLNLDLALEKMLQEYEQKYTLLSRSDIIRMLLSEIYWKHKTNHNVSLGSLSIDEITNSIENNPDRLDAGEEAWNTNKKSMQVL